MNATPATVAAMLNSLSGKSESRPVSATATAPAKVADAPRLSVPTPATAFGNFGRSSK